MSSIHPLVLCGGVGTRLWPLSRTQEPKQFQPIAGEGSATFFQATIQRHHRGIFGTPWVSALQDHIGTIQRQLRDIQCAARILAEPVARNTGPAVLAAALALQAEDADAVLLVLPADHIITGDLNARVASTVGAANDGMIVTFGITPRYPESGYGYIVDGGEFDGHAGVHRVEQFVEKPSEAVARALIETGRAYWSSGISLFRADVLIEEYLRADPQTVSAVRMALGSATISNSGTLLDANSFAMAHNEPTERAVFERSSRIALAPTTIEWDDVGAWAAFHAVGAKSADGNVTSGDVLMVDTSDSFVRSGKRLVAVVGMSDVVVVDTEDAVLVTNRQNSQKVKQVVQKLTELNRREAVESTSRTTDWGRISQLARGKGFELSLLVVNPGATVPFDADPLRRRLLTIAGGGATLQIGETRHILSAGRTVEVGVDEAALLFNDLQHALEVVQVSCDAADDLAGLHRLIEIPASAVNEHEYV